MMTQQTQIQDYLQTQALKLAVDDVAISHAATLAVLQHAQAHIDNHIIQHDALAKYGLERLDVLKKIFMAIDSAYSRCAVQTAVVYAWLPEHAQLVQLASIGAQIENLIHVDEHSTWQYLAARTAHSGWANVADNVINWLTLGELQGEHNRRAQAQISLPICGEDGVVYGVLHLEMHEMLPENALADWVGLALGILPTLRELCPQKNENDHED